MKTKAETKPPKKHEPRKKETVETFDNWFNIHRQNEPSSFNGMVRVRRFRVTIEEIPEPDEVIAVRIVELWETCDNHHQRHPLRQAADEIGISLPTDTFGIRRPVRK